MSRVLLLGDQGLTFDTTPYTVMPFNGGSLHVPKEREVNVGTILGHIASWREAFSDFASPDLLFSWSHPDVANLGDLETYSPSDPLNFATAMANAPEPAWLQRFVEKLDLTGDIAPLLRAPA